MKKKLRLWDTNFFNVLKNIDFFKITFRIQTERSIEGHEWDDRNGSWLGTIMSFGILIFFGAYIVLTWTQAVDGKLDSFST